MSRRKQLKPQHVHTDDLSPRRITDDASLGPEPLPAVCSRCCAEFSSLSDLERHQSDCSANPPVLIVHEDEDLLSGSSGFPASLPERPAGEPGETVQSCEMENINTSPGRSCRSAEVVDCFRRRLEGRADSVTSGFPEPLTGSSADRQESRMRSSVAVENLQSTKVAVAQLSQLTHSDSCRGKTSISSLLQQLLALQIQQIHQLQLIDQIRHQVLLFASRQAEIPERLVIYTRDLSASKSTNQLKAISAHLSQQLTAAADVPESFSNVNHPEHFRATEQRNQPDSKDVLSTSETSQSLDKLMKTAVQEHISSKHMNCSSSDSQLNFLSQTKMSSLMFSNNCFISKTSETSCVPEPSSSTNSIPNISEIVEDLDALAALAQQRKLPAATLSSKKSLLKCRFCTKGFLGDSAYQIHLRSHGGERLYKSNVCGNRFSNHGNLKIHFQRHKDKYPRIKMNPYLVTENLDKIQSTASLSPVKESARRLHRSPTPTTTISGSMEESVSTDLSSFIKKERNFISVPIPYVQGDLYFRSKVNPTKISASVETRQQRTIQLKSEDVKPSFNLVSKVRKKSEELVNVTHPNPTLVSSKRSNNPKLQLRQVITERGVSDPNECLICHRILSCQSALRMHFRTHTGERPYQCKLCGRAFTTKGNLKTHQAVHRTTAPVRVQHSCPICQRKFSNAIVLQQHVHVHMEGHLPSVPLRNQKYSGDFNGGPGEKTQLHQRKNFLDDGGFCDNRLSRLKSLSIHLAPSPFGKNLIYANKKVNNHGSQGELQLIQIKMERQEESNEEFSETNNQQAAEGRQRYITFPKSDSSASEPSLSPHDKASSHFKTARLDEPFQTWLNSTSLTLQASATPPTDLFNHREDSLNLIHSLREKGFLKSTFCDICGKNFACQSALDIHYRSHTKERPFICTTCNRGFSTKGNLKQHMLTHQMRDFPPHLFEPFNPNHVPNHKAIKTEMAAFPNSSFRNSDDHPCLAQSSSAYEPSLCGIAPPRRTPKQHHCKTCGKSFSSSSALQIHERTHTGERPFACAVCGRAFTTKGNLKVHMGTHMWNSAPSRRGRRLSVDRSSVGYGTRPVKLPEPSQNDAAMVSCSGASVYHWNQGPVSPTMDDKEKPVTSTSVCLNELRHTVHGDLPVVNDTKLKLNQTS